MSELPDSSDLQLHHGERWLARVTMKGGGPVEIERLEEFIRDRVHAWSALKANGMHDTCYHFDIGGGIHIGVLCHEEDVLSLRWVFDYDGIEHTRLIRLHIPTLTEGWEGGEVLTPPGEADPYPVNTLFTILGALQAQASFHKGFLESVVTES